MDLKKETSFVRHKKVLSQILPKRGFRTVVEKFPLSIQLYSPDGRLLKANKAWEKMWGVKLKDLQEYNILKDIQLKEKGVMPLISRAFKGETVTIPPLMYEPNKTIKNVTKVQVRWVRSWMYPIKNSKRKVKGVYLIHQDVTGQRMTEERMQFHASISRSISDAVIATDNSDRIVSWNKGAEELYGWTAVEVIGKNLWKILSPQFIGSSLREWQKYMKQDGYWKGEVVQQTKDGSLVYILSSTSMVHDIKGLPVGYVAINRDITLRRKVEDMLKESEEKFRSLVESNILGVIQATLSGEIIEANDHFLKMIGYRRVDLEKRRINWVMLAATESKKLVTKIIKIARQKGNAGPAQIEFLKSDGSRITVLFGISLLDKKSDRVIAFLADMTKQRKTEEDLQNAKKQLEIILGSLADGITVQESSGSLVFANDIAAHSVGFKSAKEMLSASSDEVSTLFSRFDIKDEQGNMLSGEDLPGTKALAGESKPQKIIQFYDKKHDVTKWSLVKARPIINSKGKTTHSVNIMTDMTERIQLELSLRYLVEASEILASSLDYEETLFKIANLAVPTIADWCSVDIIEDGQVKNVAIAHKDEKKVQQAHELRNNSPMDLNSSYGFAKVIKTGKTEFFPLITNSMLKATARNKKELAILKSIGFTSVIIVPLKVGKNTIGAISLVSAESKRRFSEFDRYMAEQLAARASSTLENAILYKEVNSEKQRINDLVSNVPGVVWEARGIPDKQDQRIDYVSEHVEKMLGYSVREWLETPNFWLKIVHPEDKVRAAEESMNIFRSGKAGVSRFRWITKSGKPLWIESQSTAIKDDEGVSIGMRGVSMDITERMEVDNKKDEFISIASHELKTPITSVKVFTQLLRNTLTERKDEQSLAYLKRVDYQITRLEQLIGDLLDVSRMQTGEIPFSYNKFSLAELISETVSMMQEVHTNSLFQVKVISKPFIMGDRDRIGQVLINLISNAVKYSPAEEKIVITVKTVGKEAIVSVKDNGLGIEKEHQSKIFERFYRVFDDHDKTFPGLGLGLYISREIIARHRGKMWLNSNYGKGSTFYFSLPIKI